LNQITYQQIQRILLVTTSIHEKKIRNNSSSDPITQAFDEKNKFVSSPKEEFSIKVASK
jgi:hypothetical protein